jgi:uncharacterized protein with ATP-grasp and redox domains
VKTYFDCLPCLVRQAVEAARMSTPDEALQERILREVLQAMTAMDLLESPPLTARRTHQIIREYAGVDDPYLDGKNFSNQVALKLLPEMREKMRTAVDPLEMAVRLAIAGNIIDFGVNGDPDWDVVHESIRAAATAPFDASAVELLRSRLQTARSILYLADNAGELVFDRLLIEQLPLEKVTLAVKGSPILNDALLADAKIAGLTDLVRVIDNGANAPGTVLSLCSPEFRDCFDHADLVISKGQGNYETLSEVPREIFFLLKAKCPMVARHLNCAVGDIMLKPSQAEVLAS